MNSANFFKKTYFVKLCWTAAFENHVHLNSIEQFSEFQSDDINQKLRITFWKKILPHRRGNELCSENTIHFMAIEFCFSRWKLFRYPNFMKTWQNLLKATKESKLDQTFYNFSKNISETEKFEKVLNSRKDCWNNFLTSQRLILMYYFHEKILKEKTAILENILLIFFLPLISRIISL